MEILPIWANFLLILISAVLLGLAAKVVVDSSVALAKRLGISELVVGLTVVAAGTSAPEFGVTLVAAFQGQNEISVGNVVGSNIFNLGFILGGAALFGAIPTARDLVWRDTAVLVGSSLLLLILVGSDLTLDHRDGWIFITLLLLYLWLIWFQRKDKTLPAVVREPDDSPKALPVRESLRLLLGLASVGMASHVLVGSATLVARGLGLSEWVIAVTIVAAGTSLPEVATTLAGVARGRYAIGFGNVIGSDIFNLLGVLGLAGVLERMELQASAQSSLLALSAMATLTLILMRSGWRLTRFEGFLLILFGALRWFMDIFPNPPG
jgi:cation:H+ antiporter